MTTFFPDITLTDLLDYAKQANADIQYNSDQLVFTTDQLEAFASIVAARCSGDGRLAVVTIQAEVAKLQLELQRSIAEERQACIDICDKLALEAHNDDSHMPTHTMGVRIGAAACSGAIKARNQ